MKESVVDFPKNALCPEIWENVVSQNGINEVWQLKPDIYNKIDAFVLNICKNAGITNVYCHIIGSITSNSYTENADIDIHILANPEQRKNIISTDEELQKSFSSALKQLRALDKDATFIGSHPIEIYFQSNTYQDYMSVGCYDFYNKKWLVGPELLDPSFNPYSEYYKEVQGKSEVFAQRIRNMILSIYEIAVVYKKNIGTEMVSSLRPILIQKLSEVQELFDSIRSMRKVYSSPQSEEEALKFRNSREWKIADASFKLFDKYGYTAILKQFIENYKLISMSSDIDHEAVEDILSTVKNYINNADKLAEQELFEGMQDEAVKNKFKIWVDDIRKVPDGYMWIKSVDEFIKFVDENGSDSIQVLDLDHDAGNYNIDGGDYIKCLDYLEFIDAKDMNIRIHTDNPVGRQNMQRIIKKNNWNEVYDIFEDKEKLDEEEQLDEGTKETIATFALALAILVPGIVSAKTIQSAQRKFKVDMSEIQKKQNEFITMLNGYNPTAIMNGYKMWQACNILALTLYGEGRGEIRFGGLDPITDSILNRTSSTPDINRVANICLGRREGRAYQYSYWNNNKNALQTIVSGEPVVPAEITNPIERKAWETCLNRAIEVYTGNYKVENKNINSYHVKNMKTPPAWSKEMTNVEIVGNHKYGYVKTNDPNITDMATITPVKKDNNTNVANTHVVKKGDSLWKIAKLYNTTVKDLARKNNIDINNELQVGQKLKV